MPDIELTDEERRAISSLKRLSKRWPKSLWVFAGGSSSECLYVLRTGENGERVTNSNGTFDQDYIVADAPWPSDGGAM